MMIRPNLFKLTRRAARSFNVAACALALASCATVTRIPYTQQEQTAAVIPGIPGARIWADDPAIATVRRSVMSHVPAKQPVVLALSGGGADGAFGAGLLAGWSARGTRPQFTLVTGASAGALIAPFAFLGPAYDETLRSVFATGEMANLLQSEGLAGLFGTGLFKTEPLRSTNVLILPEALLVSGTPVFPPDARPKVYVVMNSKLAPDFEVVKASTLQIVRRSFETSVRANTRNTLLASYQFAKSRNWDFNLASIDSDYPKSDTIGFDLAYMRQLFDYGYQRGRAGVWQRTPAESQPPRRVVSEGQ